LISREDGSFYTIFDITLSQVLEASPASFHPFQTKIVTLSQMLEATTASFHTLEMLVESSFRGRLWGSGVEIMENGRCLKLESGIASMRQHNRRGPVRGQSRMRHWRTGLTSTPNKKARTELDLALLLGLGLFGGQCGAAGHSAAKRGGRRLER
jgi:hypothetical protein